ncbi:hypothetical protein [Crenobacter caeni]|uniref:Uncharacterized protein n=1 Tax=Crenobacter caeni TaxID=2705474 RepID=A0A6B2KN92_9NEIS|nr:hypothetical protein [Crenobacter caeni]NDV11640.1 hypothetical protein [Crenobacter caeni]
MGTRIIDTKQMREAAELTRQRGNVVMAVYVDEHIELLDEIDRLRTQLCSCPSGDGSLRWPCKAHPPEKTP